MVAVNRGVESGSAVRGKDGHPTAPFEFSDLDFDQLWHGREHVTAAELRLVELGLAGASGLRVLEVGPGGGRITPLLRRRFPSYVGVDITPTFIERLARASDSGLDWLVGDVQHLPLRSQTVDAVVMVRVFNFLPDPAAALGELHRVLVPHGRLVMSYHSVPSLATLGDDLRHRLQGDSEKTSPPVTFRRLERWVPRRSRVNDLLETAGFRRLSETVSGLEDSRATGWLPTATVVGLAELLSPFDVLPHRIVSAERLSGPGRSNTVASVA